MVRERMGALLINNRIGRTILDKLCQICEDGKVEDEEHVIMECKGMKGKRYNMLKKFREELREELWA